MSDKQVKPLKERVVTGMIWSSVHRFGTMLISFAANLILARLLTPEDFGIIGMIMVFIAISSTLVEGGFASALIQKKNPTNEDYSTIFYWNLITSVILFFTLYLTAPAIESFYQMPTLTPILRVQGLFLILNAFNVIQITQLKKQLNFKRLANIQITATILGAILGIAMAYSGFGVWSLVAQILAISFLNSILLWYSGNWRPGFVFNMGSFKTLFKFGSYMLLTNLMNKIYENIQALIIGKMFSVRDLGFYTQAKKIEEVPVIGLSTVVNQVTFPVFSELQDDLDKLKIGISKSLKAITFINFPLMLFFVIAAKPIIILLFTEKWSSSIPFLQILGIAGMLYTLNTANTNIFKSLGRSDTYFWVTLFKRCIGLVLIIIGAQFSIMGMLYAIVLNTYLFFFVNAYFSAKLSGYSISQQIKDISPAYFLSIATGLLTYYVTSYVSTNLIITLIAQGFLFAILYLGSSYLFKLEAFQIFIDVALNKIKNR
ncbi:MAG: lipopolysaccharide biosynthesis protein [Bacteroidales bacterium]